MLISVDKKSGSIIFIYNLTDESGSESALHSFEQESVPATTSAANPTSSSATALAPASTSFPTRSYPNHLQQSQGEAPITATTSFAKIIASTTQRSAGKTPPGIKGYLNYPGKITWKKKPVTGQHPYVISAKSFRLVDLEKNRTKIQKKRNRSSDNWMCVYCEISFQEDEENDVVSDWVQCDKCKGEMHVRCVPESHIRATGFTGNGEENFECELCQNAT